ncbi:MAG: beta-lactamase family protein [Proteobacteria bacterium]|nr:beta-lactamase family protein [Pseudomonadota bacterium]
MFNTRKTNSLDFSPFKKTLLASILSFLFLFPSPANAKPDHELETKLETFMAYLMETLDVVPGYSIAVATTEGPLLAKGYGTTSASDDQPMDADTQVYIASSTKSLTGLAVASLANKGLIDLDTPIEEYLPDLAGAPAGGVTLRQLLSHTHGLQEGGLTWRTAFSGQHTPEILLEIVKNMPLSENPNDFSYTNTGYVIASLVLEHHFDKSWKTIVEEEVLKPAGMTLTTAYVSALGDDYARPHSWYGIKNPFTFPKKDNTMHAAGGHFSTASDMARWLQAQLSDGIIDGKQVFAPGVVASTQRPQTSLEAEFYTYKRHHYGFGWYQADYNGHLMYHHFGSFSGYRAHVSFIPELGIGVAVLINDASQPGFYLPDMIANYIYDLAAGVENPEAPYREEIAKIAGMIQPMVGKSLPERPRNAPDDEARYAGSYYNEDFGTISFLMVDRELVVTFGNLSSKTTYKENGSIRMELTPYNGTLGEFVEDQNGVITGIQYRGTLYARERGE